MEPSAAARPDTGFDVSSFEPPETRATTRWIGWRLRLLAAGVLLLCLTLFLLIRWLATSPFVDVALAPGGAGQLALQSSDPAWQAHRGKTVVGIGADARRVALDSRLLQPSTRWQVDDAARQSLATANRALASTLREGEVTLHFADGSMARAPLETRGLAGLGAWFWPLAGFALLLALSGVVVLVARPRWRNALFALMCLGQAGNLVFIAVQTTRGVGLPDGPWLDDMLPRLAFDLVTAAATVHAFALHPRRLDRVHLIAALAWASAGSLLAAAAFAPPAALWWWAQGLVIAFGVGALVVLSVSHRTEPNPFAAAMRRLGSVAAATLALLTLAVAVASARPGAAQTVVALGPIAWTLFYASLLLLTPFLSRTKQALREFALLAGISTVATSLDLLFVAVFSFGPFASLTLAVFVALALYAGARQWILNQVMGSNVLTTERLFEQLYRVAREVQREPARTVALLSQLLRDLFEPLELQRIERRASRSRVAGAGSVLMVPVSATPDGLPLTLVLRYARRGRRLFTQDDARLADRVVEQLRRAVAYDQAVERGRSEERSRIAQDLHDDIGARLLTLMYQAPTPEMEDYVRHTLQDLKTLTRGLAAGEQRLSDAAAEWKADLAQRLASANIALEWSLAAGHDPTLSVVQWSALTRVLRELASNAIVHAQASKLEVAIEVRDARLVLSVADDGSGRDPEHWSRGLGLGGVSKRVRQLGGEARWLERQPSGIACEVSVPGFGAARERA